MDSTFERCPHDRENPYVMINRDLTRNVNLSFQARGFILYLLAHADGWKINRKFIMKSQNIGKDKLKSIVDELVKEGFMKMESERLQNGTFSIKYLVSEFPRFKEMSTIAGLPIPVEPPRESRPIKKEQEEKNNKKKDPLPVTDGCFSSSFKNSRKYGTNLRAMGTNPRKLGTNPKDVQSKKRREWAFANEWNAQCGYARAWEDKYVVLEGNHERVYFYSKRDPFWENLNL